MYSVTENIFCRSFVTKVLGTSYSVDKKNLKTDRVQKINS